MTETHKIRDLATMIDKKTGCGIDNIKKIPERKVLRMIFM